jgi:Flp pilus assembly protein TadG
MMRFMLGRLFRRTGGQAMAELALVLPVVLFFLVAMVEVGTAFRTYQIVTNGAREGARAGVVPTGTTALVTSRIADYLTQAGLDPNLATVTQACTGLAGACSSGTELQVQVSYPFSFRSMGPVMRLVCGGCGDSWGTVPLTTTSVMRNE